MAEVIDAEAKTEKKQGKKLYTKYVVEANCFFNGVYRKKGEILDIPADEKVTHAYVTPLTEKNKPEKRLDDKVFYDPISDDISDSSLSKALEGIPGIRR